MATQCIKHCAFQATTTVEVAVVSRERGRAKLSLGDAYPPPMCMSGTCDDCVRLQCPRCVMSSAARHLGLRHRPNVTGASLLAVGGEATEGERVSVTSGSSRSFRTSAGSVCVNIYLYINVYIYRWSEALRVIPCSKRYFKLPWGGCHGAFDDFC